LQIAISINFAPGPRCLLMALSTNYSEIFPRFDWMKDIGHRTPRRVRFRFSTMIIFYYLYLALFMPCIMGFIAYTCTGSLIAQQFGKPFQAEVMGVSSHRGSKGGVYYRMKVKFINDRNEMMIGSVDAGRGEFIQQPIGEMVPIHHLEGLRLLSRDKQSSNTTDAIFGVIFLAALLALLIAMSWDWWMRRSLLISGEPIEAKVLEIVGVKNRSIKFSYEKNGAKKTGRVPARGWTLPKIGETVLALADPDRERVTIIDTMFEWELVLEN
jgi:hypothetical protein